ncbi:phosphatidylinositol-4-phosphate 5-kinase family protein [Striga asiatica]|uniref:Phosphatidylinositol-4-phosphate 5-kinase family protein n=1 Tax=Striga asiatica TaxID=4170 RepID=A0A5A7RFD3_STRAF|nr:phosphatidylinositol-4-phosphate 5-kinase family protein [Striga asiatica]
MSNDKNVNGLNAMVRCVEQTSKVDQKLNYENQRGAENVRSHVPSREFMMKNRAMEKNEKNETLDDSSDSDAQIRGMSEIGFGNMLLLNIIELPMKLGYWVHDSFDPKSCEISLGIGLTQDELPDLSLVSYTSTLNDSLKMLDEQPQSKHKEQQVAGKRVLEGLISRQNEVIINGKGKVPTKTNEADAPMVKSKGIIKQAHPILQHTGLRGQAIKETLVPPTHFEKRRYPANSNMLEKLSPPYGTRVIALTESLNKFERDLCHWIMYNSQVNMDDVVFSNGQIEVQKGELITLRPSKYICSSIIDVWSIVLNHIESECSPNSPLRFFASTKTCFFFPIHHAEQYSVVCFDIKKASVSLFDSSTTALDNSLDVKYNGIPMALGRMLSQYLEHCGLVEEAAVKRNIKVERIKMSWEKKRTRKTSGYLKFLRGKYCAAILAAENNMLKNLKMFAANMHYQLSFEDSSVDVVPPWMNEISVEDE